MAKPRTDIDWTALKNEYVNGTISYREMAAKYGIALKLIAKYAKRDNWVTDKEQLRIRKQKRLTQKTMERMADVEAKNLTRINNLGSFLLDKIEKAARDELDLYTVHSREVKKVIKTLPDGTKQEASESQEHVHTEQCTVDMARLKQLTAALREITEVIQITSQKDASESDEFSNLLKLIEGGGNNADK